MVQITHARQRNSDTGAFELVPAVNFDKSVNGQKKSCCPDENCPATLTHYQSYHQTFYSPINGSPYKLKIAAHYKREAGSPQHDLSCTAVDHYAAYQHVSRDMGVSLGKGAFVFNLNIPTDTTPAPVRQRNSVPLQSFNDAALVEKDPKDTQRRKLSEGVNDVKKLARLLDATEFDRQYRESIALRNGGKYYTLSQIFEDSAVGLFRSRHELARKNQHEPALVQFKPIAIGKYHSKKAGTIQGQAVPIKGADGKEYAVSVMLHCANDTVYDSVKKAIHDKQRSFLVYADKNYVNLEEFVEKKRAIHEGTATDHSVLVHVHVSTPQQICAWVPTNGQLDLEEAGLELPEAPAPHKEISAATAKPSQAGWQQLNLI